MPVWFTLRGVPSSCFHEQGICYLASRLGTPLALDYATSHRSRLGDARVQIEMEADKPL